MSTLTKVNAGSPSVVKHEYPSSLWEAFAYPQWIKDDCNDHNLYIYAPL